MTSGLQAFLHTATATPAPASRVFPNIRSRLGNMRPHLRRASLLRRSAGTWRRPGPCHPAPQAVLGNQAGTENFAACIIRQDRRINVRQCPDRKIPRGRSDYENIISCSALMAEALFYINGPKSP